MARQLPLWACPDCGIELRSDPTAGDDWGGEEVAVGPDCPECECEMELVTHEASSVEKDHLQ